MKKRCKKFVYSDYCAIFVEEILIITYINKKEKDMKNLMMITLALILFALQSTAQTIVNIPDANFRTALIAMNDGITASTDNNISVNEIDTITRIDVYQKNISDLTGIGAFTELKWLDCDINNLTALDLSKNTKLDSLFCGGNKYTELDLSGLSLTYLSCIVNLNLTNLDCSNNNLTYLEVTYNENLTNLDCSNNNLTYLDCRKNRKLDTLDCSHNKLTKGDDFKLTVSSDITHLDISYNEFIFDNDHDFLENADKVKVLNVSHNSKITELRLTNLDDLEYLDIRFTGIISELNTRKLEMIYVNDTNIFSNSPYISGSGLALGTETIIEKTCDESFTWEVKDGGNGKNYTESTNDTLLLEDAINIWSFDSIRYLDLTIGHSNTGTDVQTACETFTWIDGEVYTTDNDNATYQLTNASGCDSVVTLNLTITTLDNTVSEDGGATLTANADGLDYQWIDGDGNDIEGEIGQSFTATKNGDYAVVITDGTCERTSEYITINSVGINDNFFSNETKVKLYPNPVVNELNIEGDFEIVRVFDLTGKMLVSTTESRVDMRDFRNGVYIVNVDGVSKKIIKR